MFHWIRVNRIILYLFDISEHFLMQAMIANFYPNLEDKEGRARKNSVI